MDAQPNSPSLGPLNLSGPRVKRSLSGPTIRPISPFRAGLWTSAFVVEQFLSCHSPTSNLPFRTSSKISAQNRDVRQYTVHDQHSPVESSSNSSGTVDLQRATPIVHRIRHAFHLTKTQLAYDKARVHPGRGRDRNRAG